jgi:hypothetical protein
VDSDLDVAVHVDRTGREDALEGRIAGASERSGVPLVEGSDQSDELRASGVLPLIGGSSRRVLLREDLLEAEATHARA